jgi:hypothetical protein
LSPARPGFVPEGGLAAVSAFEARGTGFVRREIAGVRDRCGKPAALRQVPPGMAIAAGYLELV